MTGRLILDVSSTVRWAGPPVGILRVEQALAACALASRPEIILSFHDAANATFRAVRPEWAETAIGWDASIDTIDLDYRRHQRGLRRWRPSRYPLLMALERRRLTAGSVVMARGLAKLQQLVFLGRQPRFPFTGPSGRRLAVVPFDMAVGEPLSLGPRDILLSAGSDWSHKDADVIGRLKRRFGFRYVVLCFDIIPLLYPEFFLIHDVDNFRRYWAGMFPLADKVILNSRRVEADVRGYCRAAGLRIGETAVLPLGYDPPPPRAGKSPPLRTGLEPGRFALFVSTIEPRKGHGLLLEIWQRLLAAGVPQRHRFNLVFVGRRGWDVDAVLRRIDDPAAFGNTLFHLGNVDDAELAVLYREAAFCLYPSVYEGFGLPIVEAFAHGKAVIASTGGALPETVGALSPCLDPHDEDAWHSELKRWIEHAEARAPYEERIRSSFSHPTWTEAAARIFAAARAVAPAEPLVRSRTDR